jgi:hypothetical protein
LDSSEEGWVNYIRGPMKNKETSQVQASRQLDWQLRLDDSSFSAWQSQQQSHLLFFDGAATGNPGVESAGGGGGVIYDSEGNKLIDYSWGLGKTTNNKAEFLAAYMGLNLAQDRHI